MEPTIKIDQWFLTLSVDGSDVRRGDIIVFGDPDPAPGIDALVSRVVAVGGDTVEASDGRLEIDGIVVDEPYLPSDARTPDIANTVVPPRSVYVIGDNRGNTQGSHVYGPIPFDEVSQDVVWIGVPGTLTQIALTLALCVPFVLTLSGLGTAARRRDRNGSAASSGG